MSRDHSPAQPDMFIETAEGTPIRLSEYIEILDRLRRDAGGIGGGGGLLVQRYHLGGRRHAPRPTFAFAIRRPAFAPSGRILLPQFFTEGQDPDEMRGPLVVRV